MKELWEVTAEDILSLSDLRNHLEREVKQGIEDLKYYEEELESGEYNDYGESNHSHGYANGRKELAEHILELIKLL